MASQRPIAIYDACVLYTFHVRNLLVQCAVDGLVNARWSGKIQEEWSNNLLKKNPGLSPASIERAIGLMGAALPGALVTNYQKYLPAITLPDADDRHVVAAGIAAQAELIVTWNVRDFPARELTKHGLAVATPDDLLMRLYDRAPRLVMEATANAFRNLTRSGISASDFVQALGRQRLLRFAKTMKDHVDKL